MKVYRKKRGIGDGVFFKFLWGMRSVKLIGGKMGHPVVTNQNEKFFY